MAYIIETITDKSRMAKPFGMKEPFSDDLLQQADRVEIMGSSFEDPGPDWCEFRLMADEQCLESVRIPGY